MLRIHYFASVREAMQREEDKLERPDAVNTVAELMDYLAAEDERFAAVADAGKPLLVAINHTVSDRSATLSDDDEVAFFPPMTGG